MFNLGLGAGFPRRTPQGVRGLKFAIIIDLLDPNGRTPQGVRGLKS